MIYGDFQRYDDKSWLSGGVGQEEPRAGPHITQHWTLTSPHQAVIDLGRNFLSPH